jgi:hypothetical protein
MELLLLLLLQPCAPKDAAFPTPSRTAAAAAAVLAGTECRTPALLGLLKAADKLEGCRGMLGWCMLRWCMLMPPKLVGLAQLKVLSLLISECVPLLLPSSSSVAPGSSC